MWKWLKEREFCWPWRLRNMTRDLLELTILATKEKGKDMRLVAFLPRGHGRIQILGGRGFSKRSITLYPGDRFDVKKLRAARWHRNVSSVSLKCIATADPNAWEQLTSSERNAMRRHVSQKGIFFSEEEEEVGTG